MIDFGSRIVFYLVNGLTVVILAHDCLRDPSLDLRHPQEFIGFSKEGLIFLVISIVVLIKTTRSVTRTQKLEILIFYLRLSFTLVLFVKFRYGTLIMHLLPLALLQVFYKLPEYRGPTNVITLTQDQFGALMKGGPSEVCRLTHLYVFAIFVTHESYQARMVT